MRSKSEGTGGGEFPDDDLDDFDDDDPRLF